MYSLKPTPFEVSKALAERHRAIRRQLKMSQSEMAESSGVSLGSLKRFENQGKISLESFLKLVHIMGRLEEFNNLLHPIENMDEVKKLFSR